MPHLCTIVAPVARAIRLLSVFRRRRMAEMPPSIPASRPILPRKCMARSDRPFSVITMSGLCATTSSHMRWIASSSSFKSAFLWGKLDSKVYSISGRVNVCMRVCVRVCL